MGGRYRLPPLRRRMSFAAPGSGASSTPSAHLSPDAPLLLPCPLAGRGLPRPPGPALLRRALDRVGPQDHHAARPVSIRAVDPPQREKTRPRRRKWNSNARLCSGWVPRSPVPTREQADRPPPTPPFFPIPRAFSFLPPILPSPATSWLPLTPPPRAPSAPEGAAAFLRSGPSACSRLRPRPPSWPCWSGRSTRASGGGRRPCGCAWRDTMFRGRDCPSLPSYLAPPPPAPVSRLPPPLREV